jgi:hypothetical protein
MKVHLNTQSTYNTMLFSRNYLPKATNVSRILKRLSFLVIFLLLLCVEGFSQDNYTSKASGDWTDPSTWTPPSWLPNTTPNNAQTVTIAAGHTVTYNGNLSYSQNITIDGTLIVTGSFTHSNLLTISSTGNLIVGNGYTENGSLSIEGNVTVTGNFINSNNVLTVGNTGNITISGNISTNGLSISGKLKAGGNYYSSGGSNTINTGGTMIIEGDAQSHVGFSVQGSLLVSGNYTVTGGTLSIDGNGMLAVGKNFQNDWQNVFVNDSGKLLVMGNLITNAINKSSNAQIAVLGDLVIGTWNQTLDNLGCKSYCKQSLDCTSCQILDFIDPTHPDWILPEGITSFWWEDFNSNAIGDTSEGTKWDTTDLSSSRASVQKYSSSNTNHVLYFDPATNVTGTIWETEEIPTNCYKKITISAYLFQEKNNGQGNAFFEYMVDANGTWQAIPSTSSGLCQKHDIQASSIKLRLRADGIKKTNIIRLDNVGISGTATCGGSTTVPSTPGAISGPQVVCASTSGFTYSISPVTNATGYTWQVPSGWTVNTGIGTTTITVTSGTTGGTITVTADNSHGSSNPQTKIVTVTATNTASNASSTPTVCINTAFTPITHTTTGATGIGTATGLPTGVTASWASNTITISGTPTASGTFNYSIPLTGGCGVVNATGTIRVNPENTISAPSSTPTICINSALSPITHITTGADGLSSVTGLPPGVTANWASNTITINGTPTVSGTFNYAITVTGGCGAAVAFGTITVIAQPTTATVGSTQNICGVLTSNALGGNTPAVGTGQWSIVSGGTGTFSNNASGNSAFTANAYGSYVLRWTISNGVCAPSTADIIVNFYQTPTTANAGTDQSNCNNSTFTLAGNSPSVGTGLWTVVSGSATISNPNSPASTLTNLAAGNAATLRWTITNGTCSSTDDVTLTNYATPTTANAGTDQSNCNNSNFTLNGNVPTIGTGLWSVVSGSVTITNPGTATSTVTNLAVGTNATLRWTITNGACSSADDVILTNYATPTTATVGATQNICEILVSNTLNGNTALVGTSTWTIVSGGTGTFSAENSGSSTFTADNHGTYVLRWTISNGICTPSTADITVNFYAKPTTASISATKVNYIETLTTTPLGGNTPVVGTGAWSITNGSTGTFSLQNQGNSTFTANEIGDYTLTWKITNGTCSSTADIITHFYTDTRWNGTNSSDWATALNWTPREVPDGNTAIVIPATINSPVISGSSPTNDVNISGKLKIQDGATLTLDAGPVLTINSGANASTINGSKIIITSDASYLNLSLSSPTLQVERQLTGVKGWRMVSSPVSTTYADMFKSPLVTQGFSGSTFPDKQPNLLLWDETDGGTSLQSWRKPAGSSSAIPSGEGHFHYIFNGAGIQSSTQTYTDVLPQTMTATGNENALGGHSFNLTYTPRDPSSQSSGNYIDRNTEDKGWNLKGNPTASTLDWDLSSGWTKTNIDNTIYIWDPTANGGLGDYLTWNGISGTLGSGRIAPFQAFWVHANNYNPGLSFTNDAKTAVNGTFLKTATINNFVDIPITLSGEGMETTSILLLSDKGESGPDKWDGYRLEPMNESWLALYMRSSLSYTEPLVINDLPLSTTNAYIPLYVDAQKEGQKIGGSFTLQWEIPGNWPEELNIQLMDHDRKKAISMLQSNEYKFDQAVTKSATFSAIDPLNVPTQLVKNIISDNTLKTTTESLPFSIVIGKKDTDQIYLDKVPVLFQNYPNPFSESTTIRFSLPDIAPVQIDVFDVFGRLLATPFKGTLPSGIHDIVWTPNTGVSGVLIVRLTSNKTILAVKALRKQ